MGVFLDFWLYPFFFTVATTTPPLFFFLSFFNSMWETSENEYIPPPPPALTLLPVTAHEIQCHCRLYCSQTPKSHMKSFLAGHSLLQTQFDSYNFL